MNNSQRSNDPTIQRSKGSRSGERVESPSKPVRAASTPLFDRLSLDRWTVGSLGFDLGTSRALEALPFNFSSLMRLESGHAVFEICSA
jgi:hypothetical protein